MMRAPGKAATMRPDASIIESTPIEVQTLICP